MSDWMSVNQGREILSSLEIKREVQPTQGIEIYSQEGELTVQVGNITKPVDKAATSQLSRLTGISSTFLKKFENDPELVQNIVRHLLKQNEKDIGVIYILRTK